MSTPLTWFWGPLLWLISCVRSASAGGSCPVRTAKRVLYGCGFLVLALGTNSHADTITSDTVTLSGNTESTGDSEPLNGAAPSSKSAGSPASRTAMTRTAASGGAAMISEFRTHGPSGSTDEYVELLNTTSTPLDLTGWALQYTSGGVLTTTTLPSNAVIPASGHYLITGTGYNSNLTAYATGDLTLPSGIDIDQNSAISLLDTSNALVDDTSGVTTSSTGTTGEFAFVRDASGPTFSLVSTDGNASNSAAQLGAPGPKNLSSPIVPGSGISISLVYSPAGSEKAPNRIRNTGSVAKAQVAAATGESNNVGVISFRRAITNTTGKTITGFRVRVVNITSLNSPGYSNSTQAEIRLISSASQSVLFFAPGDTPHPIMGTTVQTPPTQARGGALNTSATENTSTDANNVGTITLTTPLPNGASRNYNFTYGVMRDGNYFTYLNVEAILDPNSGVPTPTPVPTATPTNTPEPTATPTPPLDARVRVGTGGAWTGEGTLDATGGSEVATQSAEAGTTATFYASVVRQSAPVGQTARLRVPGYTDFVAAGGEAHFFVGTTSQEITSDITSTAGWSASIAPGQDALVRVEVNVPATATAGSSQSLVLQTQDGDTGPTPIIDAVKMTVTALSSHQPDVVLQSVRADGWLMEAVGSGIFNDDQHQTLSNAVSPGQTQSYKVSIRNASQSASTFIVSLGGLQSDLGAELPWNAQDWSGHATLEGTPGDIFSQLQGGWPTPLLAPDESVTLDLSFRAPYSTNAPIPVGSFRVVARDGTKSDAVTGNLASQFLTGIEWSRDGETWTAVTGPLSIPKLQNVGLRAVAANPALGWDKLPGIQPEWSVTEPWETHVHSFKGEMIWIHAEDVGTVSFGGTSGAQINGQLIVTPELPATH